MQDTKLRLSPNLRHEKQHGGKTPPTQLAQDFFDTHYKQVYGSQWHSMRLALLSKPKFTAMVNNFSAKDETMTYLKSQGCMNIKDLHNEGKASWIWRYF